MNSRLHKVYDWLELVQVNYCLRISSQHKKKMKEVEKEEKEEEDILCQFQWEVLISGYLHSVPILHAKQYPQKSQGSQFSYPFPSYINISIAQKKKPLSRNETPCTHSPKHLTSPFHLTKATIKGISLPQIKGTTLSRGSHSTQYAPAACLLD